MAMKKETICFDFDGVIHSYVSGWKGIDIIPNTIVPGIDGAIKLLRSEYRIVVHSTRCNEEKGLKAIKDYLDKNNIVVDDIVDRKPRAILYVDDRAFRFEGDISQLLLAVKHNKNNWINEIVGVFGEEGVNRILKTGIKNDKK